MFRFIIANALTLIADNSPAALRITGRNDGRGFHHQNDCSFRGAGAMLDTFGNDKSLLSLQIDRAIFEIDDKVSLQDKEELVSSSCLCQWYSPCTTPRRTTESFTWQSVWLYHLSVQAFTRAGTSTKRSAGNLISR